MDMSSMSLTNLLASSLGWATAIVEPVADVVVVAVGSVVASGAMGANEAAKVDGIFVVTIGIAMAVVVSRLACYNYLKLSNSFSISFNWSFSWRMKSIISSYWVWLSKTSLVYGCSERGSLSCFFKAAISSFFFFISFSASLTSLGLYPSSITKSSNDLILLSLVCKDAFSSLYYVLIISSEP